MVQITSIVWRKKNLEKTQGVVFFEKVRLVHQNFVHLSYFDFFFSV